MPACLLVLSTNLNSRIAIIYKRLLIKIINTSAFNKPKKDVGSSKLSYLELKTKQSNFFEDVLFLFLLYKPPTPYVIIPKLLDCEHLG